MKELKEKLAAAEKELTRVRVQREHEIMLQRISRLEVQYKGTTMLDSQ